MFWKAKTSPGKSPRRRTTSRRCSGMRSTATVNLPCPAQGPGAHGPDARYLEGQNLARKITTASDYVAPVQRSLPPSMRATVTVSFDPLKIILIRSGWRTHSVGMAPSNRPHRKRGVPTPSSGGPRNRPHQIGLGRRVFYHTVRSGCPESMRLALDTRRRSSSPRKGEHPSAPLRLGRTRVRVKLGFKAQPTCQARLRLPRQ